MSAAEAGGMSQDNIDAMLAAARATAGQADEGDAPPVEVVGPAAEAEPADPDEPALDIDAILTANDPDPEPEQEAPPQGPMSLADRLAAMGMAAPEEEPAAESPTGGTLGQAAIDAMRARAEASAAADAEPDAGASGGTLSQAMIDAMRAPAEASEVEPEPETGASGGTLGQAAIDAMRARAEAAEAELDAGTSGGTLSQAMIDAMRVRAEAEDVTEAGSAPEAALSGDSGEISLEELMSAGVTPGQPLPGSEALSGVTLDALLGGDRVGSAAAEVTAEPEGDGVEISVAELLAAGIHAVPRGPRTPRPKAAAAAPAPQPVAAAAPVFDEDAPPNLALMMDVGVEITAEIGSISMPMDEVMSLYTGTILSLNTHAEEPVRLLVNGLPLALGEVVVVDEKFGVRVTALAAAVEVLV